MTHDKDAIDKILDHNRQQLSALMDGELSPDEARFLWRRLQHDESLARSLSRWQLCGDILRGEACAPAPEGFARGVAAAIAEDPADAAPADGWRPARWGTGLALAASVAVVALFVARQAPQLATPDAAQQSMQLAVRGPSDAAQPAPVQAIAKTSPEASVPMSPAGSAPRPQQPDAPGTVADVAAVAAAAELPRRAMARRSRGQSQRAARRVAAQRDAEPQVAIAAATPAPGTTQSVGAARYAPSRPGQSQATAQSMVAADGGHPASANPFTPRDDTITTRPWPRALLPAATSGAFNVDYGREQATGGFYPFQLRAAPDRTQPVPAAAQQDDATATAQPVPIERADGDMP